MRIFFKQYVKVINSFIQFINHMCYVPLKVKKSKVSVKLQKVSFSSFCQFHLSQVLYYKYKCFRAKMKKREDVLT